VRHNGPSRRPSEQRDELAAAAQAFLSDSSLSEFVQCIPGYASGAHGFLFNLNGGTYTTFDDPLGYSLGISGTFGFGINDMGQVVGSYLDNIFNNHGFLYSGGVYTTLDVPLAEFTTATGINGSGQIVGYYTDASGIHGFLEITVPNPPPPVGTTADMILRRADGTYEIYDIGNNAILAGYQLGQVGTDWKFVGLGGFNGTDTTDMLLRSASTGGFEVYDISNNNITGASFLGNVGMDWQVMGFGNFSSMPGETDMILRNVNSGGVEVYDISNNNITGAAFMGAVGLNWQFSGVGNFSGRGESDMILRNSNTGGLEVYDIANNQLTGAPPSSAMSALSGSSRASATAST
jgi:hypothetical protein